MKFLGSGPEGVVLQCSSEEYELLKDAENALHGSTPWRNERLNRDLSPLFRVIYLLTTEFKAIADMQGSLNALKTMLGLNKPDTESKQ